MHLVHSEKKRDLLESLLEKGMTLVALDGSREGVDLPEHLRGDPQVRLNLSYRFGLPIGLDDSGVQATLTFGGVPHDCVIPWEAIYLAHSHVTEEQFLFLADVPDALLPGDSLDSELESEEAELPAVPKPRFGVVQGGIAADADADEGADDDGDEEESARSVPHLRRIK